MGARGQGRLREVLPAQDPSGEERDFLREARTRCPRHPLAQGNSPRTCRLRQAADSKLGEYEMTLGRAVLAFAGFVVLVSLALGYYVSPWFFLLTVFAGANMIQASYTGFCPAALVFKALGVKPGSAFR